MQRYRKNEHVATAADLPSVRVANQRKQLKVLRHAAPG
jgi:hypothetical protein